MSTPTPQSPFAAIQAIQDEQREGYAPETPASNPVEPVTEVPADPYAELKAAWEAGRTIIVTGSRGAVTANKNRGQLIDWVFPPDRYEIEPLPADKWAAEKAAYTRGEKVEYHYDGQWWPCSIAPNAERGSEYRIAADQVPADKLSDEQLAKIYQNTTALSHVGQSVYKWEELSRDHQEARIQGIRAVREAVEKEREVSEQRTRDAYDHAMTDCVQMREEIARLTAEVARYSGNCKAMDGIIGEQQAELAKANAELERLRWRPVSETPTREDADSEGNVTATNGHHAWPQPWDSPVGAGRKFWRPFCPPTVPTAQEKERAEFEAWAVKRDYSIRIGTEKDRYADTSTDRAWTVWQAARASKEVEK